MICLVDDHLLRDWLARRDDALIAAVGSDDLATTNLWYARLCKSAARSADGALLGGWSPPERRALVGALVALPDDVMVAPMRLLAWRMAELTADHAGLSTLGAEAVAAAQHYTGRILVSSRDDGPGIRHCCADAGVRYDALSR